MSISPRTATTLRALPILPFVQHAELEQIEHGETIEDRLATQEQVDRRSDAYLWRAFQVAAAGEREHPQAAEHFRLIKAAIRDGMALDAIEDEHRQAASQSAASVQDIGRGVIARLRRQAMGGGPETAA